MGKLVISSMLAVLVVMRVAVAHEAASGWVYPYECCNDRDCEQVSSERVTIINGGYLLDGKFWYPIIFDGSRGFYRNAKPSGDSFYHACWVTDGGKRVDVRCFFVPVLTQ